MAIKTTGSYHGKSNKLGGGGRFAQMVSKLKGKVSNPKAVAASIGRKKYGAKKMSKMAAAGKKRAHEKKESKSAEKKEHSSIRAPHAKVIG